MWEVTKKNNYIISVFVCASSNYRKENKQIPNRAKRWLENGMWTGEETGDNLTKADILYSSFHLTMNCECFFPLEKA